MGNYVEIQSRRKAHEIVLLVHRLVCQSKLKGKDIEKLKNSSSNVAAELYEAHGRIFEDEKIKHISKSRGYLYEAKYYINLLNDIGRINRYVKKDMVLKIDLLDKLLISMIRNKEMSIR